MIIGQQKGETHTQESVLLDSSCIIQTYTDQFGTKNHFNDTFLLTTHRQI